MWSAEGKRGVKSIGDFYLKAIMDYTICTLINMFNNFLLGLACLIFGFWSHPIFDPKSLVVHHSSRISYNSNVTSDFRETEERQGQEQNGGGGGGGGGIAARMKGKTVIGQQRIWGRIGQVPGWEEVQLLLREKLAKIRDCQNDQ